MSNILQRGCSTSMPGFVQGKSCSSLGASRGLWSPSSASQSHHLPPVPAERSWQSLAAGTVWGRGGVSWLPVHKPCF